MVSFNHYANGAVGDFLYRRILGIEELTGEYERFMIAPVFGGNLTWAKGSLKTPYGMIVCGWEKTDGMFSIEITVPAGTSCTLKMPGGELKEIGSGVWKFTEKI